MPSQTVKIHGGERWSPVTADAGACPPRSAHGRHVDPNPASFAQSPERSGRAMGQNGSVATGEHRCHPMAPCCERGVPDCVDTVVDAVQASGFDSLPHTARQQPELGQLRQRDNSVLPLRQCRDGGIRTASGEFRLYVWRISPLASHGPMVAPSA